MKTFPESRIRDLRYIAVQSHNMTFCAIKGNERPSYPMQLDKGRAACYIRKQLNTVKAGNETSRPPAGLREPGKVRAGANAETEWTREPLTERDLPQ